MAAGAAKYGHCAIGYPVEYRSKVPFRPEIAAPLDLAVRVAEIYALDRELDRSVLEVGSFLDLLRGSLGPGLGPVDFRPMPSDTAKVGPPSAMESLAGVDP
ncbi:MAG: hypothetical protein L3J96_05645, partial [Thermoplasmata archaeon]|nr:hypothetical protein [Thermoplasmata archaeon]